MSCSLLKSGSSKAAFTTPTKGGLTGESSWLRLLKQVLVL
jgi:hypothetical protein